MKLETEIGTYEKYNLKKLNDSDLEIFWRIIQDTWSFYFQEYLKCNSCDRTFSKKDIYKDIESNFGQFTIEELEKKYGSNINCKSCDSDTEQIWGESYITDLEKSLTQNIYTNLVTFRNKSNTIVGITYCNVDPLEKIFKNDLSYDFLLSEFQKTPLINRMQENFILTTGLSILEREQDGDIVNKLLAFLYKTVDNKYHSIPGIFSTIYRTQVYRLYKNIGVEDLNIQTQAKKKIRLMYSENMIDLFKKKLSSILV